MHLHAGVFPRSFLKIHPSPVLFPGNTFHSVGTCPPATSQGFLRLRLRSRVGWMSSQWRTHRCDFSDVKADRCSRRQFPDVCGQVEFGPEATLWWFWVVSVCKYPHTCVVNQVCPICEFVGLISASREAAPLIL